MDVVIPPLNIHFREVFGSFQLINEGGDEGEQVGILDRMLIEILIVLARAEPSVFLLNEEEWEGLQQLRFPNFARPKMFLDECLTCLHFFWVHGICFGYLWGEGLFQVYSVVEWSLRREFSFSRFVEDFGIFGVLWREFLLYFLSGLC